jgi:hypothetical protein
MVKKKLQRVTGIKRAIHKVLPQLKGTQFDAPHVLSLIRGEVEGVTDAHLPAVSMELARCCRSFLLRRVSGGGRGYKNRATYEHLPEAERPEILSLHEPVEVVGTLNSPVAEVLLRRAVCDTLGIKQKKREVIES